MELTALREATEMIKTANGKLDLVAQFSKAVTVRIRGNVMELDGQIKIETSHVGNGASITTGKYTKMGSKMPDHCHGDIVEFLICSQGSFSIGFPFGYRILKTGECASIPVNTEHSATALEDDSYLIAVCIPAEPTYSGLLRK